MLKLNYLTVKNFMSIGNQTQAIDFNRNDLTLVLGENLDMGGDDSGAKNGTGKTSIINALSYGLYGSALTNIKKNNLINKTNGRNLLVTVEFEINNKKYRIERGRKPNILKFYVNDHEQEADDYSQGDSRKTQEEIEKLLSMTHSMFKHVLALNTYTEPFLSMNANDQRTIIEQLLGITLLSEKSELLREEIKKIKDEIKEEEFKINAQIQSNKKIQETIDSLNKKEKSWIETHTKNIDDLKYAIQELNHIDINKELQLHLLLNEYNTKKQKQQEYKLLIKSCTQKINELNKEDKTLDLQIQILNQNKCPTCEQTVHDTNYEKIMEEILTKKETVNSNIVAQSILLQEHEIQLNQIGELGIKPEVFYENEHDAREHSISIKHLEQQLEQKINETNPYTDQIQDLKNEALVDISYTVINKLSNTKDHQEFLLKLLTNKDSYIRKKIIDQNLSFLNSRLGYYLEKIGLPHTVKFQNDLSVEITEYGRDLDFDNLSRGERNRLILSLSWAFRDVWENLYHPINLLFIDELIDSGMDTIGVENSISILKKISRERKKSVWLISHKDDLISRVNNVLVVTKENGFTTFNTDIDIL